MELVTFDIALRGGAVTLMGFSGVAALVARPRAPLGWAVAASACALSCYLVVSAPGQDPAWLIPGAAAAPAMVWWLMLEIFDEAAGRRLWVAPLAVALAVLAMLASDPLLAGLRAALALALFGHIGWVAWSGDPGDLIAVRRMFRRGLLGVGATIGLAITGVELVWRDAPLPPQVLAVQAAMFLALAVGFCLWLVRVRAETFPSVATGAPARPGKELTDAERAVATRLDQAMADEAWRDEGLSVGALATRLDTSEHRLRRVINRGLGHRNFATFINGYRIAEARRMLADPTRADRTVLEIAHEVGFASLGPFNRAFRAQTGQSPSEWRRSQGGKHAPQTE